MDMVTPKLLPAVYDLGLFLYPGTALVLLSAHELATISSPATYLAPTYLHLAEPRSPSCLPSVHSISR